MVLKEPSDIFAMFVTHPACNVVQTLEYEQRCDFVRNSAECKGTYRYINYLKILYCVLRPESTIVQVLCTTLLMSLCIIIYIILGCTVDKIFIPALKVVSKYLGLNEHLAGVTLLAFGNGSPDLIGTLTTLGGDDSGLLADLFGASVYVVSAISGLLVFLYPFQLQATNVLRDSCFFALGVLVVDYCMASDRIVTFYESILIISVYVSYLIVIFLDQYILKQNVKTLQSRVKNRWFATAANLQKLEELRSEAGIEIIDRTSRLSIDVDMTRKMSFNALAGENANLFGQFFQGLNPLERNEWTRSGYLEKIYIILKTPIIFLLILVIPVVDYEADRHGWSKLLNSLQIPVLPALTLFVTSSKVTIYYIPLWCYTFLFTVPIGVYVFLTTRTDLPPNYHYAFAIYDMVGSVLVIYVSAGEAVEVLRVLGIVTSSSTSFLGCTLQAWGNSIVDLVSTISLARNGYPRMGFAACIGGPFFNSIISIGGSFMYRSFNPKMKNVKIIQGTLGENCVIFLFITLSSITFWSTTLNFHARSSVGIYNLLIYLTFFTYVLLGELEIVETFAPEEEEGICKTRCSIYEYYEVNCVLANQDATLFHKYPKSYLCMSITICFSDYATVIVFKADDKHSIVMFQHTRI